MVALSTLIAAFGLELKITAVVIGAMLVAPLMTPILGLALGLVRGEASLIGIALRSEAAGVALAVAAAAMFGAILLFSRRRRRCSAGRGQTYSTSW